MRAMVLEQLASLDEVRNPLELVDVPVPEPGEGQVLIKVSACGVCHTELDEIEGRTAPPALPVIPGHEVVGVVAGLGRGVTEHRVGDRVGVGWIFSSSGAEDENLSPDFVGTGRDANGGYAEYMVAPQHYACPIPDPFSDPEAAPLLCAGAIGYRSLKLTGLQDGQFLGLTGFGASAHLVLQLARARFPASPIQVFARSPQQRAFAMELGAAWAGDTTERAPEPMHAIIDTTPAWTPVVEALRNLRPGGRLVINAIRKEETDKDYLASLSYHEDLWMEKEIKSVANITRYDIAEFLPLAAAIPIRPEVETFGLQEANEALLALKRGATRGAKVLVMSPLPVSVPDFSSCP
jgi:alcohol dehydrogenase, propanol-preferring